MIDYSAAESRIDNLNNRAFYNLVNRIINQDSSLLKMSPIFRMQQFDEVMQRFSPSEIAEMICNGRFDISQRYFYIDEDYSPVKLCSFDTVDDSSYPIGGDRYDAIVSAVVDDNSLLR